MGSELGQGLCGGVRVATRKRDGHQVWFLLIHLQSTPPFFFPLPSNLPYLPFPFSFSCFSPPPQVALKLIDMEQLKETFKSFSVTEDQLKENVLKEIEILRLMKHRNIVRLEDTWVHESKTFLCLELVPGEDLLSIIPEKGLAENLAKNLFFQICSAVVYCHANNVSCFSLLPFFLFFLFFFFLIAFLFFSFPPQFFFQVIHGDLKPENILVSTVDGRVKLIDFGFAHIVKEGVPLRVCLTTCIFFPFVASHPTCLRLLEVPFNIVPLGILELLMPGMTGRWVSFYSPC